MIVLSWNCRGMGNTKAIPALKDLIRVHRPDIIFLAETLAKTARMEAIKFRIGFEGMIAVDCIGRSGGICLLWRSKERCVLRSYSSNHIDVEVMEEGKPPWRLTGFYGYPERSHRKASWDLLTNLATSSHLPWAVIGDFNDIINSDDKKGLCPHPNWCLQGFRDTTAACGLADIELSGFPFTWARNIGKHNEIRERLDRAMVTKAWLLLFPMAVLRNGVAPVSDHSPIILQMEETTPKKKNHRFRFENKWLREEDFDEMVGKAWRSPMGNNLVEKLRSTAIRLSSWGRSKSKNSRKEISLCNDMLLRLRGLSDPISTTLYDKHRAILLKLLIQEEDHWRQRAKLFWLKEGDSNTKAFHSYANNRRRSNRIISLFDNNGHRVEDGEGLGRLVMNYFSQLFTADERDLEVVLQYVSPKVNHDINRALTAPYMKEEFTKAIFQMHPDKSPGPDGFNPGFFQHCWHLIGDEVFTAASHWLSVGFFPPTLNDTLITLIPKSSNPNTMKDLRPISLCNVVYKIIAKVVANRLQPHMPSIISENQSAFMKGRLISDNVLLAFESIHSMKCNSHKKSGEVALKVDISKAFDKMDWNYLKGILLKLGFNSTWVNTIMLMVSSVSYSIRINDNIVGPITPYCGLRQGDPLSPYLFIICMEGLSALMSNMEERGLLHGVRAAKGAPPISHLFFADDSLFFFRASLEEARTIHDILLDYEAASGQSINFTKSGIMCSPNVDLSLKNGICSTLGVWRPLDTGNYLGLPSLVGRKKKIIFAAVKERLWKSIQSWANKPLSKAGKATLIKAVAQSIPVYLMGVFRLPKSTVNELHHLINSFWWGTKKAGERCINWMSWEKLTRPLIEGGLNFKDFASFNIALLGKQAWNFIYSPNKLVSKVFKAKYFPKCGFLEAKLGASPSFIWRSLWQTQGLLAEGLRWRVGDGTTINFWSSKWLKRKNNPMISSPIIHGLENLKVSDVMSSSSGTWKTNFLKLIVNSEDLKAIHNSLPVNPLSTDSIIWGPDPKGLYTVKSAYKLLVVVPAFNNQVDYTLISSLLWRLNIPLKVKFHLWRLLRDTIPTRVNLRRKGVEISDVCPLCNSSPETSIHIFFECVAAKGVWSCLGMSKIILPHLIENFSIHSILAGCLMGGDSISGNIIAIAIWCLWKGRNNFLWKNLCFSSESVAFETTKISQDWLSSVTLKPCIRPTRSTLHCSKWHPPPPGILLCNVDAAIFSSSNSMGLGAVLRNNVGEVISCRRERTGFIYDVKEAEALALRRALSWVINIRLIGVIFETDSKLVVDAINSDHPDISDFGVIIDDCRRLLTVGVNFSIRFIRRDGNHAAHSTAKAAFFLRTSDISFSSSFLTNDVLSLCLG